MGFGNLQVWEMVAALGRGAGRIGQDNERGRLGRLLGKGVVKDEAVHASCTRSDIIGAHGDLVGFAFANPFYGYEAFVGQKILRIRLLL